MVPRSFITRLTATAVLALSVVTIGTTPGTAPTPAHAALAVAAPTSVQRVVAGDGFACAVVNANNETRVMCAGKNSDGQLGDGTTTNRSYLSEVSDWRKIDGTRQLVAGKSHVCALSGIGSTSPPGDQTLYCWGDNQYGQLGTGNFTDSSVPVKVADSGSFTNSGIKSIIAGDNHTCAVVNVSNHDKLFCWGLNNKGQLGDASTTNSNVAVAVQGVFAAGSGNGTPVTNGPNAKAAMAAGAEHTCAAHFTNPRTLYCWGENGNGQLGNNSTTDSSTPVSTSLVISNAQGTYTSFMAAGDDFTCAVDDNSSAKCWGANAKGQMGNGNSTDVLVPTAVPANSGFSSTGINTVVAGGKTVCMVDSSLIVWCWGANDAGQIGDNTQVDKNRPTSVSNNSAEGFTNGQLGGFNNNHTGVTIGKSVTDGFSCLTGWCWGGNSSGQLALNNTTRTALPTKMLVGTRVADDVTGATVTAEYTSAGVVVTFTGVPSTGLTSVDITVAPTTHQLLPSQRGGIGVPFYSSTNFSGGSLPTVSGNSFSVTVPNMTIRTLSMSGPPSSTSASFESTGSYHLLYSVTGTAATGYPDGWRLRNNQSGSQVVIVTGTTPSGSSSSSSSSSGSSAGSPGSTTSTGSTAAPVVGSYANAIPGVTVTDAKIYTAAPRKVADGSAISVLTSSQAKTLDITSRTPSICLPNDEDLVFLDEGRCVAQVVNTKTRKVLRTLKTTVVDDDIADLKVGNEVAVLTPLYFFAGSSTFKPASLARLAKLKDRIEAAGSVLIAGHSGNLMGNTPENIALSGARARATVAALKARGSQGPFAIAAVGALDPASTGTSRAAQDKNRRSVIVLIP